MLKINDLHAYYGKSHVLHGVSFDVQPGEIVALLGRNGSGRSTTAKAIMGMVDASGTVDWEGRHILGRKPYEIAHMGIGYVPESRDIFPRLTGELGNRMTFNGTRTCCSGRRAAARAASGRSTTCTPCSPASRNASTPRPA